MAVLIAVPIFIVLVILQSAVVSAMPLLHGSADIILLTILAWAVQDRLQTAWLWSVIAGIMVSLVSGLTFGVFIVAYLVVTGITLILRRRIWKAPWLAMLAATFLGTLVVHAFSLISRWLTGNLIQVVTAFNLITLPSLLLNLLLAIPVFYIVGDIASRFNPDEIRV